MVALLRGINVGGNRKVPMADLRALGESLGLKSVATYIQSGNLVCVSSLTPDQLERAIEKHFGFEVPVIVRTGDQWAAYARGSAYPEAETERPNLLHLGLSKRPVAPAAMAQLQSKMATHERVTVLRDALWLDFSEGVARSKLSPAVLDRAVGSTVTARNWKTVVQLNQMLQAL